MDVDGVYDNLQDYNLGESVHNLQEENKRLSTQVKRLENDITKLCENVLQMKNIQNNLTKNISELYKTAKAEIARKDRNIADLRSELEDHLFRRNKINNYNQVGSSKPSHAGSFQQNVRDVNNPIKIEQFQVGRDTLVTKVDGSHNEYLPVLEDTEDYLPDEKRCAIAKRQREEKHEDASTKRKKVHYDGQYDFNQRSRSNGRNFSRDKRYDDRRPYEDRQISENPKFVNERYDRRRKHDGDTESVYKSKSHDKIKKSCDTKENLLKSFDRQASESRRKLSYERKEQYSDVSRYSGRGNTDEADPYRERYRRSHSTSSQSSSRKTEFKEEVPKPNRRNIDNSYVKKEESNTKTVNVLGKDESKQNNVLLSNGDNIVSQENSGVEYTKQYNSQKSYDKSNSDLAHAITKKSLHFNQKELTYSKHSNSSASSSTESILMSNKIISKETLAKSNGETCEHSLSKINLSEISPEIKSVAHVLSGQIILSNSSDSLPIPQETSDIVDTAICSKKSENLIISDSSSVSKVSDISNISKISDISQNNDNSPDPFVSAQSNDHSTLSSSLNSSSQRKKRRRCVISFHD